MLWIETGRQSYFINLAAARFVVVDYELKTVTIAYDTTTETVRNVPSDQLESVEKQLAEVSLTAVIAKREATQQAED
jgi:hypothetical protein